MRICIELDLRKKIYSAILIFGRKRHVKYQGHHLICFKCGKYKHHKGYCVQKPIMHDANGDKDNVSLHDTPHKVVEREIHGR